MGRPKKVKVAEVQPEVSVQTEAEVQPDKWRKVIEKKGIFSIIETDKGFRIENNMDQVLTATDLTIEKARRLLAGFTR